MLGAPKEAQGFVMPQAVRIELEVCLDLRDDGIRVGLALVNLGEQQIGVGFGRIAPERVAGAALGLDETAEGILNEAQAILADDGTGLQQEAILDDRFGVAEVALAVEDHGKSEERRREAAVGEIDGFLEIVGGIVEAAKLVIGKSEIVIGPGKRGRLIDGDVEIGEAGLSVALHEQLRTFLKSARGFSGQSEFLNGDNGVIARS